MIAVILVGSRTTPTLAAVVVVAEVALVETEVVVALEVAAVVVVVAVVAVVAAVVTTYLLQLSFQQIRLIAVLELEAAEQRRLMREVILTQHWLFRDHNPHYIPRDSLVSPSQSPGTALLNRRRDSAYLATMGITVDCFDYLLEEFAPIFTMEWRERFGRKQIPHTDGTRQRGRQFQITPRISLAITLHFLSSMMKQDFLSMIFGMTRATIDRHLRVGLIALLDLLKKTPEAAITWPTLDQIEVLKELIEAKESLLKGAFAFLDGLKLNMQQPRNPLKQNAHFNAMTGSRVSANNLILSDPRGCIIWCYTNVPGSRHDEYMAAKLAAVLKNAELTPPHTAVIADTAFPASSSLAGRIITPLTDDDIETIPSNLVDVLTTYSNAIKAVRQAAECESNTIKKSAPRLYSPLPAEDDKFRGELINCACYFTNFRSRLIPDVNEGRTVFHESMGERKMRETYMCL